MYQTQIGARLGIKGTLEFRNAAGKIIKTIDMNGSVPLEEAGLTVEQAQTLIEQQEKDNGTDRSE